MHLQHCLAKACSTGTTSGWMRPDPCIKQADRARVCLALTCGLPGAGKTSVCKAILASSKSDVLVRHICFDDTIEVDPSEDVSIDMTNATTFKASRQQTQQLVEQCVLDVAKEAHQWPTLILADDNMYYRSMRYAFAQLARRHDAAFMQLYLPCSVSSPQVQDAALARNARRKGNQRMPEEVIRHMAQRLEAPDCQRYEWERNTVTLPSENLPSLDDPQGWVKIWDTIMANWRGPLPAAMPPQQQGPPTEASASTAHSLDLQLRRMLADAVACIGGAAQKADAARQLNAERKQLLARVCIGEGAILNEVLRAFREVCSSAQADVAKPGKTRR